MARVYDKKVSAIRWLITLFWLCVVSIPFIMAPTVTHLCFSNNPYSVFNILGWFLIIVAEFITGLIAFGLYNICRWINEMEFFSDWWKWVTTQDTEDKFVEKI